MAEINADLINGETTETILVLPEASNPINNITVMADAAGAGRTVTITAQTQTASALGDVFEAPAENSVVDVADGLPHTYLFPVGTMIKKIKLTPNSEFEFSAKCASAR